MDGTMTADRSTPAPVPPTDPAYREVGGGSSTILAMLRLLRPHHWIKNALVLAPLVFAGLFLNLAAVQSSLVAAGMFSIAASAGYVYNDLQDIEEDRRHPVKRHRPLPSGDLTPTQGWGVMGGLIILVAAGAILVPWTVTAAILAYLALGGVYSSLAKEVPVVDLFAIAIGFVLRIWVGAEAIDVGLSAWMAITTLCLALYLGTIKRLSELSEHGDEARDVLTQYNNRTLEGFALISATCALVFYALYAAVHETALILTLPFVLFGLLRYWHLVAADNTGTEPIQDALSDKALLGTVAGWAAATLYFLWPG